MDPKKTDLYKNKKVAILLPWLKMGGTNKIALNFMRELSQYCEVTLILSEHTGELLDEIPDRIPVIVDRMKSFQTVLKDDLRHVRLGYVFRDAVYYAAIKRGRDSIDNYKYIVDRHAGISEEEFDCAVSYHGQSPERLLNLLYRVQAKKKAVWIHGEMSFSEDKTERLKKYYRKIDHFFFVSKATRDSFGKLFPFALSRAIVYYNPIDRQSILHRSQEAAEPVFSDQYINLLTVGRLSREKGQTMIPAVVRNLLDRGYPVRWYIVGDGDTRPQIEGETKYREVEDAVFLLGVRTNPYPMMKSCTIYVQPSFTEGYSTTICEAAILGKAIIGTKSSGGIYEQITDGEDGMIAEADEDSLTEAIAALIDDAALRGRFERNILEKDFEGRDEIRKFLQILN